MKIHPAVKQIINRDCHVSLSNRQVIRHVISRLHNQHATFTTMPKKDRKTLLKQCIAQHNDNIQSYVWVMGSH